MNRSPYEEKINNIFSGELEYVIPRFQRKYVWSYKQLDDFFDDIENLSLDSNYFIGCFIFEKNLDNDRRTVVDGQQRITTILIVLSLIAHELVVFEKKEYIDYIKNRCYFKRSTGEEVLRIKNDLETDLSAIISRYCFGKTDFSDVTEFLKREHLSCRNSNLQKSFIYLEKKIRLTLSNFDLEEEKINWLDAYRNKVTKLFCVTINTSSEQEGYKIFEVLNSRGALLAQHELIKNYILMHDKTERSDDTPSNIWNRIISFIDIDEKENSQAIDNFFSCYITHKFGLLPKGYTDFLYFKKEVNPQLIHSILLDLHTKAKWYNSFLSSKNFNNKEGYILNFFNTFNIRIIRPFLISLFEIREKNVINEIKFLKVMDFLKKYFIQYVVIYGKRTNSIDNIIKLASYNLSRNNGGYREASKIIEIFENDLKLQLPKDEDFNKSFMKIMRYSRKSKHELHITSKNKNACQLAIMEYEIYSGNIEDCKVSTFTLEHVKNDSEKGFSYMLGNLIPLQGKQNNSLKNKSIDQKLLTYKKSNFQTTKDFVTNYINLWDDEMINKKTLELAKLFESKIWNL